MKIAFIGIGKVGLALADHLERLGHSVTIAARDPSSDSVVRAQATNPRLAVAPTPEAVREAEVVFLATLISATPQPNYRNSLP